MVSFTLTSHLVIFIGIIFLCLSLIKGLNILKIVPKALIVKWKILLFLILFFIIGYLIFILLTIFRFQIFNEMLIIFIMLGGTLFVYVILSISDKTIHAMNMNEKLEHLNTQLKETNMELIVTQDKLKQLLEQKNQFIHILSHDLKNPLTTPMTLLPLIEKQVGDEHVKEMVQTISYSIKKIKNFINDTIKLSRLDSIEKSMNIEKINLFDLVEQAIHENEKIIDQYHFTIENNVSKELMVDVDKFLLDQVFDNLISNAIKYTPEEHDQRAIISTDLKDDIIVVSVEDFGRGIKQDNIKNAFDMFSKNAKPRDGFDSTGLGLSICKGIIDRHGGKIWVESKGLGKGSTFFFTLPIYWQKQNSNLVCLDGKKQRDQK